MNYNMKKQTQIVKVGLIAALAALNYAYAGPIEDAPSAFTPVTLETGYSSDKVWRGADLGANEANAIVTTTTELPADVSLALSADYANAETTGKDEATELSAIFSKEIADYLVSLSYTWYSQDYAGQEGQAQEAGLTVSRAVGPIDLSLTQYMSIVGDNNAYSELAATYSDDFGSSLMLDFRAELGYLAQEGQCTHFETTVSTDIPVVQGVTAVPFVSYSLGLDDSVGVHSDMKNLFFGGIEFKKSF
jgi:hypothetical protein